MEEYLAGLPEDRRRTLSEVRRVVVENLPKGFEEVVQYGMVGDVVPLERFPDTYDGQPLAVASLGTRSATWRST